MRPGRLILGCLLLTLLAPPAQPGDPDRLISELRRIARELTVSVRQFQADLDREISLHDRGYRAKDGRRIPGADSDLNSGPADQALETVQKLITSRMLCARRPGYEPLPLADADRIENLIAEARARVVEANEAMRQFLVVPASLLNSREDAGLRATQNELARARGAATDAAKRALEILPLDLSSPGNDSSSDNAAGDRIERTWTLTAGGLPVGKNDGTRVAGPPPSASVSAPEDAVLPLRPERGKNLTLIREPFRRIALTDSGVEDGNGRRLFYQEEWVQRQGVTILKRWAVTVDTATGQHALLRRFETREFAGELDEAYRSYGTLSHAPAELPEAFPHSPGDLAIALVQAERSRDDLRDAVQDFQQSIRSAMVRREGEGGDALDGDLPGALRESLFSIRGHLARAEPVIAAEEKVRRAVNGAEEKAASLEALIAWLDGSDAPPADSLLLSRSDAAIRAVGSLEREALAALPPDVSKPEAQFPAMMKDLVVRMKGVGYSAARGGTVRCRQEIWRVETSSRGRRVRRTISVIDIETRTGAQSRVSEDIRYFTVGPGDTLESIYDEHAVD